jgi:HD-GYP domain-containing protein (c-di-GMP phosphodiesterase class II)
MNFTKETNEKFNALSERLESFDETTAMHSIRVAYCSTCLLSKSRKYKEKYGDILFNAALLHDVGKMDIDLSILNKPSTLTDEEFDIIKFHPIYGFIKLQHINGRTGSLARIIALQHHERCNGEGYIGLTMKEIHPMSRLVTIIDVYDAIRSKRPYKEVVSLAKTLELMEKEFEKGWYDPYFFNLFKKNAVEIDELREMIDSN